MTKIKYKNAPVSEVILGVTFKTGVLATGNYYLKLISKIIDRYPRYEILPPLPNMELKGYQTHISNNVLVSGPVLYRLRSKDTSWLIQIQWNKLYLNWIRDDSKDVGDYPGYSQIYLHFKSLLDDIVNDLNISDSDQLSYELTYHDRIRWQELIKEIRQVGDVTNFVLPFANPKLEPVNFSITGSSRIDELKSFLSFNYATATELSGKQILKIEFSIKGVILTFTLSIGLTGHIFCNWNCLKILSIKKYSRYGNRNFLFDLGI